MFKLLLAFWYRHLSVDYAVRKLAKASTNLHKAHAHHDRLSVRYNQRALAATHEAARAKRISEKLAQLLE